MPNNNSIINFKNGFGGGTRANRFIVVPFWPSGVLSSVSSADVPFKMVSASLPAVQINTIVVPYRGRNITFPGDRQYSTWAVGIYDDNKGTDLWRTMQKWAELMDGSINHKVDKDDYAFKNLQTTWIVKQLDLNGDRVLKTITLYNCWPSIVGEINLNMQEQGLVGFSTTLTFDYIKTQDNFNS